MGGILWHVFTVPPDSDYLIGRTNTRAVGTTDPTTRCVYLSSGISGDFRFRVLGHELSHAAMVSYGLIDGIRRMVLPRHWIEAGEWACNLIADYGLMIIETAYSVLGYEAWRLLPEQMERLIS